MSNEQESNRGSSWQTLIMVVIGSVLTLILTVVTHLWLIPSQEKRMHRYELAEQKVSKLYQPILLSTGYGNLTLTSPGPFMEVKKTLKEYGHLADEEVIDKFIDFLKLCDFANYEDLTKGSSLQKPLPDDIILEIIRKGDPVLKWDSTSLANALKVEKEFYSVVRKYYKKAYEDFMSY